MKLSLVVAEGVHKGKAIPVAVAEFVIGRDEDCQLRPSSPAVSKRHCSLMVKGDSVFVQDFGSTNGTFVNGEPVAGETEVKNGDKLVVGPLVFQLKMEASVVRPPAAKAESKETKLPVSKTPAMKTQPPKPVKVETTSEEDAEQAAAMLLGTDDGPAEPLKPSDIPEGSTVFDIPAVGGQAGDAKKPAEPLPTTSSAADAILRKYMRRPRA